jgi:arginase
MMQPSVTNVDLLLVPYDSARRDERMGAGPAVLADALQPRLLRQGFTVRRTVVEPAAGSWQAEIRTAFELADALATSIRATRAAGRFPLVLTGNCGAALGVVAALGAGTRVLWADAHADFNTPETTESGFLDGMALSVLTGRCWTRMAARVAGFGPVPEDHVWLLGARDLDTQEVEALAGSGIRRAAAGTLGGRTAAGIAGELGQGARPYVHLDLDVLDRSEGHANAYASGGGVTAAALADFCGVLARTAPPAAITLSAYDPAADADRRVRAAALHIVDALLARDERSATA